MFALVLILFSQISMAVCGDVNISDRAEKLGVDLSSSFDQKFTQFYHLAAALTLISDNHSTEKYLVDPVIMSGGQLAQESIAEIFTSAHKKKYFCRKSDQSFTFEDVSSFALAVNEEIADCHKTIKALKRLQKDSKRRKINPKLAAKIKPEKSGDLYMESKKKECRDKIYKAGQKLFSLADGGKAREYIWQKVKKSQITMPDVLDYVFQNYCEKNKLIFNFNKYRMADNGSPKLIDVAVPILQGLPVFASMCLVRTAESWMSAKQDKECSSQSVAALILGIRNLNGQCEYLAKIGNEKQLHWFADSTIAASVMKISELKQK